jgi:hypothetical protein
MSGKSYFSLHYGDATSIRDDSNNELLTFDVNSSATNNLQITNNASGSNVSIEVIGDDTDIGLNLNPKGHGKVNILGSTSNAGGIRFYGNGATDDSSYIGLNASTSSFDTTDYFLPSSDGTNGQVLKTDGSGVLSFTDSGSGTPAGSDTHIQFNNGGDFGASSNLTWDDTNIVLASGKGIAFVDANEKISGDGSNLTVNSSRSILLTATSNVVIPSSVPLSFATDDAEKISGNGTDLTINSGANINLTCATGDVKIPNDIGVVFGDNGEKIEGDGTDLTVTSSHVLNLTPGSTSNVVITQGTLILSSETITSVTATKAVTKSISYYDVTGGSALTTSVVGQPVTAGQIWHVLFDNADNTGTSLQVNFGSNGLASGSGLAQYITFNTHGQSASLIYIGSKWRIINTGAAVS